MAEFAAVSNEKKHDFIPAGQPARGIGFLTDFWKEKYLQEYIKDGGSKIKFITGREGSGKTYFLR